MTELAIVVLNYRTPDLTLTCIESLQSQLDADTRLIVVDNASGDGSADRIEQGIAERQLHAEVLRSPINGGFAAGMNFGIQSTHADAYVLLNSDTVVRPGALASLRAAMQEHPSAGIIGPAIIGEHGEVVASYFRDFQPMSELLRSARTGPIQRLLKRYSVLLPEAAKPIEPDWIAFACALVRREVIERIGPLDDGYFMYFEDVDYCRRARAAGFKVLYWPSAKVVHFSGGSSGVTDPGALQKRAPRYYYEARARYFAKFFGLRGLWLANGFWHLGRSVSWSRERLGRGTHLRQREAQDIWTNALTPLEGSS